MMVGRACAVLSVSKAMPWCCVIGNGFFCAADPGGAKHQNVRQPGFYQTEILTLCVVMAWLGIRRSALRQQGIKLGDGQRLAKQRPLKARTATI
jgi:hypothetical protein